MMKKLLMLGLIGWLVVGSAVYAANPRAARQDSLTLAGLDGEVTVKYDGFGIPHIYATTPHDLFMVQGYVTAQDRWWQMEWSRHQAHGTTAELLGESMIGTDTFLRTLGLTRNAQQDWEALSPEMQDALQAYADGVNAWLEGKTPAEAAIEYRFIEQLGAEVTLEDWTPLDTLTFAQAMAINFEQSNIELELLKAGLIDAGGPLAPLLLLPIYDYEHDPLISEPGWRPETASRGQEVALAAPPDLSRFQEINPLPMLSLNQGGGSNSWAISGDLTDTGKPILANDPHIGQGLPSVWYEIGLHCVEVSPDCPFDVYGYVFPGAPGVILGHNQHIAWGMTVSGLDTIDVYTLELNPDNPLQYRYNGEWRDIEVITETIEVAGGDPIDVEIKMTHFGPMIHELVGFEQPMAAHVRASAAPCTGLQTFYYLNQATNWEEFQQAVAYFDLAGQNVIYADVDGNIGIISGGRIPRRAAGHDGTTPVDGTTDQFEWQGFLDPSENPRLFNPEAGYIVAANNAFLRPEDFPVPFASYYDYGYRARRIETLIQAEPVHSVDSVIAIQNDTFNPSAGIVMPVLKELEFDEVDLNAARDWLAGWDMHNHADSPQAALYNAFWLKLMPLAFDELAPAGGVDGDSGQVFLMRGMILGAHPLWNNAELGINDRDEILKLAFQQGYEMMVEMQGDNPDAWRWDAVHYSYARHSAFRSLDEGLSDEVDALIAETDDLFSRKIGVPGGTSNVNNQRWNATNGNFILDGAIVSMRMIVDFSDLDNSRFVHGLGQSGDPSSPHYDDMMELWATGQYHPSPFTAEAVDALTEKVVTFAPAP